MKIIFTVINLLMFFIPIYSQIYPKDYSKLNCRCIGFSFPKQSGAKYYKIEIATGFSSSDDDFKKNMVKVVSNEKNNVVCMVPYWGKRYTWRYSTYLNGGSVIKSPFYHFNTTFTLRVDTFLNRLRVVKKDKSLYMNSYVFLDANRVLYDMNGEAIWFLPDLDSSFITGSIRDLKITPQGTITFLVGTQTGYTPIEINYNAEVLWKGPAEGAEDGERTEMYHHQFTRLSNGNYMVLGTEHADVFLNVSPKKDSIILIGQATKRTEDSLIKICSKEFGTLIEYNKNGEVIWHYKSSNYFNKSDLIYHRDNNGNIDAYVHDNAFYFDEVNKVVYMSFKNINRVIKIKYPEGIVTGVYGDVYKPDRNNKNKQLFCGQHDCRISNTGNLYLFNNNSCRSGTAPTIVLFKLPNSVTDTIEQIWEYQCTVDGLTEKQKKNLVSVSGGSVSELPGDAFFVCMGNQHSKIFIVNNHKCVLWAAVPETWDKNSQEWNLLPQYKASIINGEELQKLIWNSNK